MSRGLSLWYFIYIGLSIQYIQDEIFFKDFYFICCIMNCDIKECKIP